MKHIPGVGLAHLASSNPESRTLVSDDCIVTSRWEEVAENRHLDGIILATPPAMHLEMALAAIRAGIPVLVEKPMTLSLTDAHILADGAMSHNVLTMVGHTHLYSSAFRQLKRNSEALGQLIHTRSCGGNWGPFRPDATVRWDWGPHDIAMCLDLLGAFPFDIHADRIANVTQLRVDGEAIAITLKFDCGAYSKIHLSNLELQKRRFFEAAYDGGSLVYDDLASDKLVFRAATANVEETVVIDQSMPLTNLVEEFCSAIGRGNRVSDSLALGLKVVEVLAACQASLDLK